MATPNVPPPLPPGKPGGGPPINALKLWEAIAREEGFYVLHSRAQRNNNPGNMEYGPFTAAHGATGSDGRFAIFESSSDGFNALRVLLSSPEYCNDTLEQWVNKYAPSDENDTEKYLHNIVTWCNATPETIVNTLL